MKSLVTIFSLLARDPSPFHNKMTKLNITGEEKKSIKMKENGMDKSTSFHLQVQHNTHDRLLQEGGNKKNRKKIAVKNNICSETDKKWDMKINKNEYV